MAEMLDIVDDDDNVIGSAERGKAHAEGLMHRSVMFFIMDGQDRILVNQRSQTKDFFPGAWSIALGGHVSAGQTYEQAAEREAMEEAGVSGAPILMGAFKKRIEEESENVKVFAFVADEKPKLDAEEIEKGDFLTVEEAETLMDREDFLPETGELLGILKAFKRS